MAFGTPIGNIFASLSLDTRMWTGGFKQAEADAQRFQKKMDKIAGALGQAGRKASARITAPLLAIAGISIKKFADFDAGLRNVQVISKETDTSLKDTAETVRRLAIEFGSVPTDLTDALFSINSASRIGAEGLKVLEAAQVGATAGAANVAQTADALTTVLNAYALSTNEVNDVSDVLFRTNEKGKLTFNELANQIGIVVGTASAAKISFGEVGAAIATITRGGIRAAEATTGLNALFNRLLNPSAKLAAVFQRVEGASVATTLKMKGLARVVEVLEKETKGSAEELINLGFRIRDLRAITSLTRNEGKDFASDIKDIATRAGRAGSTIRALNTQMKGLKIQLNRAKIAIVIAAQSLGEDLAPAVRVITAFVIDMAERFRMLSPQVRTGIVAFAAFAAAIGPVLIVLGGLVALLGFIPAGLAAIPGLLAGIAPAIVALTAGALLLVGAFVAIKTVVKELELQAPDFANEFNTAITMITGDANDMGDSFKRVKNALLVIKEGFKILVIEAKFSFKQILNIGEWFLENMLIGFASLWDNIVVGFKFLKDNWKALLSLWLNLSFLAHRSIFEVFSSLFTAIAKKMKDPFGADFEFDGAAIKQALSKAFLDATDQDFVAPEFKDFQDQYRRNLWDEMRNINNERKKALEDNFNDINLEAPDIPKAARQFEEVAAAAEEVADAIKKINQQIVFAKEGAGAFQRGSLAAFQAIQKARKSQADLFKAKAIKPNLAKGAAEVADKIDAAAANLARVFLELNDLPDIDISVPDVMDLPDVPVDMPTVENPTVDIESSFGNDNLLGASENQTDLQKTMTAELKASNKEQKAQTQVLIAMVDAIDDQTQTEVVNI